MTDRAYVHNVLKDYEDFQSKPRPEVCGLVHELTPGDNVRFDLGGRHFEVSVSRDFPEALEIRERDGRQLLLIPRVSNGIVVRAEELM